MAWDLGGRWGIAAALVLLAALPTQLIESGPALCPSRALAGRTCPGCGITRAVSAGLHGEFARAVEFHRGVVVVLPILLLLAGRQLVGPARRRRVEGASGAAEA